MPKAVLLVFSKPASPEREDEYNQWYDAQHLGEVTALPGFTGATRYKLSDENLMPNAPDDLPYLAIYEMDSDDLNGTLQELAVASGDGRVFMSDAICMDPVPVTQLYELRG